MRRYLSLFRIRFITSIQYRAAALAGVVTQFAWGSMELLALFAFYKEDTAAFPMTFQQTASYIWLQQAFLTLFFSWFFNNDISGTIESGSVAYEMVRPIDLYRRWYLQSVASRLARALLRCIPILVIALILPPPFRLAPPESAGVFALFLMSMSLSTMVVVAYSMLIYISMFFTLSITGLRFAAGMLADFLAGAIIPLPFFPETLRKIAEALPFASMQNMPLRIYSGNIAGADAARGIILQAIWFAVLVIIGRAFMARALKKVVVQGG